MLLNRMYGMLTPFVCRSYLHFTDVSGSSAGKAIHSPLNMRWSSNATYSTWLHTLFHPGRLQHCQRMNYAPETTPADWRKQYKGSIWPEGWREPTGHSSGSGFPDVHCPEYAPWETSSDEPWRWRLCL